MPHIRSGLKLKFHSESKHNILITKVSQQSIIKKQEVVDGQAQNDFMSQVASQKLSYTLDQ